MEKIIIHKNKTLQKRMNFTEVIQEVMNASRHCKYMFDLIYGGFFLK